MASLIKIALVLSAFLLHFGAANHVITGAPRCNGLYRVEVTMWTEVFRSV